MPVGMLPPKQVFALVSMLGVSHIVHEAVSEGQLILKQSIHPFGLEWISAFS